MLFKLDSMMFLFIIKHVYFCSEYLMKILFKL